MLGGPLAGLAAAENGPAPSSVGVTVVIPVLNGMRFLPRTAPSVLAAATHFGNVVVRYADNGSTDGTLEFLRSLPSPATVCELHGGSIAALRNRGARDASGEYISFIDADCTIPEDYLDVAVDVLRRTGAVATGCETHAPADGHWIEATWHALHYVGRDRDVHYLNSANFFIRRDAFEQIGGFREDLRTGEDAEIGQRIITAGLRIHESTRVEAIHYGNPRSIGEFFRRTAWHGLGMFATVNRARLDRPVAMSAAHLVASLAGLGVLLATGWPWGWRVAAALGLQLLVPAVTVVHRIRQTRRRAPIAAGLLLYWLYYWARLRAMWLVLLGKSDVYRK